MTIQFIINIYGARVDTYKKENSLLQTLQESIPGTLRCICCQAVELKSSLAKHMPFMDEGSFA